MTRVSNTFTDRWSVWLNEEITLRGWNPAEAARQIGVGDGTISKWRRGLHGPTLEGVRMVAKAFGVSTYQVLVAIGYLSELGGMSPRLRTESSVWDLSSVELARVLATKLEREQAAGNTTPGATVIPLATETL